MRGDGADFLIERLRLAAAALLHIDEELVPRVIELAGEDGEAVGLLRQIGGGGLERIGIAAERAEIQVGEIAGSGETAQIGARLPDLLTASLCLMQRREARIEIGFLLRPIGLGALDRSGDGREIEGVDRVVIALHLLQTARAGALEIDPMRGFVLRASGVAKGGRAKLPHIGEELIGFLAIAAVVLLFDGIEALHVAAGRLQHRLRAIKRDRPLAAGGDGAEERRIALDFARDFILGVRELRRRRRERGALGIDGGASLRAAGRQSRGTEPPPSWRRR